MPRVIRWGILGPGRIAHKFAEALKVVKGTELQAVGSRTQANADAFGEQHGIPHRHASYEVLAQDPEVEVIYIATPHPMHHAAALLCLEAGKHVLCEKPFTINRPQAEELVRRAREQGLFLMEAMWTRFLPTLVQTRRWITAGAIGEVRLVQASFCFRAEDDEASRLLAPELGGGGLLDVGVYPISLSAMAFGAQPERIASMAHLGTTGVDEQAGLLLGHAGGGFALISCAVRTTSVHDAYIFGTDGYVQLHTPFWSSTRVSLYKGEMLEDMFEEAHRANGFEYQIEEVCTCLREGRTESRIMPLDETVAIMGTMDEIRSQWGLRYPGE